MPICVNGRCYCLADVICLVGMWQMLLPRDKGYPVIIWMADVIAIVMWQMFFTTAVYCNFCIGWCYCQVADGIATCYCLSLLFFGQMLLPCGRWNSHYFVFVCDERCYCPVADGMATSGCEWFPLVGVVPGGRWIMGSLFKFQFWGVMQNLIPYMR